MFGLFATEFTMCGRGHSLVYLHALTPPSVHLQAACTSWAWTPTEPTEAVPGDESSWQVFKGCHRGRSYEPGLVHTLALPSDVGRPMPSLHIGDGNGSTEVF